MPVIQTFETTWSATQSEDTVAIDLENPAVTVTMGHNPPGIPAKSLLLVALGGCTSATLVAVMQKQKLNIEEVKIVVSGTVSDQQPKEFIKIHTHFRIKGTGFSLEKLEKNLDIAERYCPVHKMLAASCPISHTIVLNP
eukprot:jgi/Hompol1/3066/HPOL_006351-RA